MNFVADSVVDRWTRLTLFWTRLTLFLRNWHCCCRCCCGRRRWNSNCGWRQRRTCIVSSRSSLTCFFALFSNVLWIIPGLIYSPVDGKSILRLFICRCFLNESKTIFFKVHLELSPHFPLVILSIPSTVLVPYSFSSSPCFTMPAHPFFAFWPGFVTFFIQQNTARTGPTLRRGTSRST